MKRGLIIFVRKPELGKVKTRLAAAVGDDRALFIYKNLLQHTFLISKATDTDKFVFYANEIEQNDMWDAHRFFKEMQSNDDLGGKMKEAFESLFKKEYNMVVIIGSDCFELTTQIIEQAFLSLDNNELVIGPAKDGGYYLLGMKRLHENLFLNKKWSTENVFADTIDMIEQEGLTYKVLPILTDVDEENDLPQEWKKI